MKAHKIFRYKLYTQYNDNDSYIQCKPNKKNYSQEDGDVKAGWWNNLFSLSQLFDYNHELIPPDPNFFNAGFLGETDDKYASGYNTMCSSTNIAQVCSEGQGGLLHQCPEISHSVADITQDQL